MLIEATDRLRITATDLERTISQYVDQVEIEAQGSIVVVAADLHDILREMTDDAIALKLEGRLSILGGDCLFKMETMAPSAFPPVPALEPVPGVLIKASDLKDLIERTIHSVAKESTRYAFNGILFEDHKTQLKLVATDGRRVAIAHAPAENKGTLESPIVPKKTCDILLRLLDGDDTTLTISRDAGVLRFEIDDVQFVSALVEGTFAPYRDILPKTVNTTLTADRNGLIGAVRRAALMTNEESKGVAWTINGKGVLMESRAAEVGEASIPFPTKVDGPELRIGFNPYFLLDGLKSAPGDTITMEFIDPKTVGVIKGTRYIACVLPV